MKIEQPKWKWTSVFSRKKPRHRKSWSYLQLSPPTKSRNRAKVKSGVTPKNSNVDFFSRIFFKLAAGEGAATTRSTIDKVQQDESKNSLSASEVGEIKAARLRTNEDPHPRKKLQYLLNFSFLPTKAAARLRRGNGAACMVHLAPLISPWRRPPTRVHGRSWSEQDKLRHSQANLTHTSRIRELIWIRGYLSRGLKYTLYLINIFNISGAGVKTGS